MTLALAIGDQRASGQTPLYRVTPLRALGFFPNPETVGTMGINNKGQVVYGGYVEGDCHAWLWLPAADYYFTSPGFYDLSDETSTAAQDDELAIARDINESGVIVGQVGAISYRTDGCGAVWEIGESATTLTLLDAFSATAMWSAANAVNDQSPPVIVGISGNEDRCGCFGSGGGQPRTQDAAFRLEFDGTNTLIELAVGDDRFARAYDVNTPQGENPLRITGYTDCRAATDFCLESEQYFPNMDATVWSPSTRNELEDESDNGSEGRGVNDNEEFVGMGYTDEGDPLLIALSWASPGADPVRLGDVLPSGQEDDTSRAFAINNASPRQAVGDNFTDGIALVWTDPYGTPSVVDLDAVATIGACAAADWVIQIAHDINDSGHIVATGTNEGPSSVAWTFLLTPFPACPMDILPNGEVDTDDLLALLGQWGECVAGQVCTADMDGDCDVDTDDLLALLGEWGADPCEESLMGGDGPPPIESLIAFVLEADVATKTKAEVIEALLSNVD